MSKRQQKPKDTKQALKAFLTSMPQKPKKRGQPMPEQPAAVEFIGDVYLRSHIVRLALDQDQRILFLDLYEFTARPKEIHLADSARLEGRGFSSLVRKLARPVYPGNQTSTPAPMLPQLSPDETVAAFAEAEDYDE